MSNEPSYILATLRATEDRVQQLESDRAAMRQVLTALRVQIKSDGHVKWHHAIAGIDRVLTLQEATRDRLNKQFENDDAHS